jgi:uncharacterized protein YfdQ (DUF2303 family)
MTSPYRSTSIDAQLQAKADGAQAIIGVAQQATEPHTLDLGEYHVVHAGDGTLREIDLTSDQYLEAPKRKKGTVIVSDLGSFTHYWGRHHDGDSEVFVDVEKMRITAVLDAHAAGWEGDARWQSHRLVLQAKPTQEWADWTTQDGREQGQRTWAEFIEEHIKSFVEPNAATMLEIAQNFQTSTTLKFGSTVVLQNGDRRLTWDEKTDASAGASGSLQVPAEFTVGLQPFDWSERFKVGARFRYRVEGGNLKVQYLLTEPAEVIKAAMLDLVTQAEKALNPDRTEDDTAPLDFKVMVGTPIAAGA